MDDNPTIIKNKIPNKRTLLERHFHPLKTDFSGFKGYKEGNIPLIRKKKKKIFY